MRRRALDIRRSVKQNSQEPQGNPKISNGFENVVKQAIASSSGRGFNSTGSGPAVNSSDGLRNALRNYIVTQDRQLLAQAYAEIGLIQTICRIPVEDALKGGIEIHSEELTPKEITALKTSFENEDMQTVIQAGVWTRLFGGSGILVLTEQAPDTPLNKKILNEDSYLEFRAVDRWELYFNDPNKHEFDDSFDRYLNLIEDRPHYNYYGKAVHKTRVVPIKGDVPPSPIRTTTSAWGLSVVESLLRSLNQYLKSTGLIHEVLDEFKIDVFKMEGLAQLLEIPGGEEVVLKRLFLAQMNKNFLSGLAMDAKDDWDHKQLNFAGISETMAGIRMQVASDMRMPMTKLFGISAAGFNSGEDDIEVYNSMIESSVRHRLKSPITEMLKIKCKKMFDTIPSDLVVTFKPLREMSSEQQETVKTQKFNRLDRARTLGEITSKEFRDSCNKDDLLPIKLMGEGVPDQDEDEPDEIDDNEEKDETSYNNEMDGLRYLKRRNSLDNLIDKPGFMRRIGSVIKSFISRWC